MEETKPLEQIKARRAEAVTWYSNNDPEMMRRRFNFTPANAVLVSHAPADIDYLLSQLTTIQSERDQLKAIISDPEKWMKWCDVRVLEANEALVSERDEALRQVESKNGDIAEAMETANEALREVERLRGELELRDSVVSAAIAWRRSLTVGRVMERKRELAIAVVALEAALDQPSKGEGGGDGR